MHTHVYAFSFVYTSIYIYTSIYVYIYIYRCIYMHSRTHTHPHIFIYLYICMYICVCVADHFLVNIWSILFHFKRIFLKKVVWFHVRLWMLKGSIHSKLNLIKRAHQTADELSKIGFNLLCLFNIYVAFFPMLLILFSEVFPPEIPLYLYSSSIFQVHLCSLTQLFFKRSDCIYFWIRRRL